MQFVWPTPPNYEFILGSQQGPEECLLLFRDGTKATGLLLGFLPDEMLLKFHQTDAATSVTVTFASLQWLQLLRSIPVKRQALIPGRGAQGVFAPAELQPFTVPRGDG